MLRFRENRVWNQATGQFLTKYVQNLFPFKRSFKFCCHIFDQSPINYSFLLRLEFVNFKCMFDKCLNSIFSETEHLTKTVCFLFSTYFLIWNHRLLTCLYRYWVTPYITCVRGPSYFRREALIFNVLISSSFFYFFFVERWNIKTSCCWNFSSNWGNCR